MLVSETIACFGRNNTRVGVCIQSVWNASELAVQERVLWSRHLFIASTLRVDKRASLGELSRDSGITSITKGVYSCTLGKQLVEFGILLVDSLASCKCLL